MRIKEIEVAAAKKQKCPEYASAPELCLYFALRNVYCDYHKGNISKNDAIIEKRKIISECGKFEEQYNRWCETHKTYQDNIKTVTVIMTQIEKSSDVNEIAQLACKAISLMTGEVGFVQRQLNKFGRNEDE